jgi:hypothetical protein
MNLKTAVDPDCRSWWLVVGGWVLLVGGQHLAAPLQITHPVPDNTITTHCDAVPNHQPLTTNHVFRVDG